MKQMHKDWKSQQALHYRAQCRVCVENRRKYEWFLMKWAWDNQGTFIQSPSSKSWQELLEEAHMSGMLEDDGSLKVLSELEAVKMMERD